MKNICFTLLLFFPVIIFCQGKISGKVLSEKQVPLEGASVFIPNTTDGVLTNAKGEFTFTKIPAGNTRIAISHIGYKTTALSVTANTDKPYIIEMSPNIFDLEGVIISAYDKLGWEHWGEMFTNAFIGSSKYAAQCIIQNKDVVNFIYTDTSNILHAYASEPLVIDNNALGYRITLTLADFVLNTKTKDVDYQVYSLFTEMQGSDKDIKRWKDNRKNAYQYSLMHFMRSIYNGNLQNEGFEIRRLEKKKNIEKQRIQELYNQQFIHIRDSLSTGQLKEKAINKMIDRSFHRDSLKYYRKLLEQDDRTEKLHSKLLSQKLITEKTDRNTVLLNFNDYLHVIYRKVPEPEEYTNFKNQIVQSNNPPGTVAGSLTNSNALNISTSYPATEFILQQGIPVEITQNGYFNNIDLFMNGFWGWWEKIATKLPYGYEP